MFNPPLICINDEDPIEIIEPVNCRESVLSPEGNIKFRNYRLIGPGSTGLRAYTPTGDINTTPTKRKVVPRYESGNTLQEPIFQLIKIDDIESETLKDIVKTNPKLKEEQDDDIITVHYDNSAAPTSSNELNQMYSLFPPQPEKVITKITKIQFTRGAEEKIGNRRYINRAIDRDPFADEVIERFQIYDLVQKHEPQEHKDGEDKRTQMEKSFLNVSLRLDDMLTESRQWHGKLAKIHEDLQDQEKKASECMAIANTLCEEASALFFLDHVLTMLKGDVSQVPFVRQWPFSQHPRRNGSNRNFVV